DRRLEHLGGVGLVLLEDARRCRPRDFRAQGGRDFQPQGRGKCEGERGRQGRHRGNPECARSAARLTAEIERRGTRNAGTLSPAVPRVGLCLMTTDPPAPGVADIAIAPTNLSSATRQRIFLYLGILIVLLAFGGPSGGLIDIPISFLLKNKLQLKAH